MIPIELNNLISILKAYLFPEDPKYFSACQHKGIDWEKTGWLANAHGVLPICYQVFIKSGDLMLRAQVERYLKAPFLGIVRNNLLLASELTVIHRLFKEHHIDILPYKGPMLAESVYGDVSLRQFGDLDIFIRIEDIDPAIGLLEGIGYELKHRIVDMSKLVLLQSPIRSTWECNLVKVDSGILVELQSIVEDRQVGVLPSFDDLWQSSRETILFGARIRGLSPEILLLALCDHGCRHAWSRLIWLMDVARFVQTQPVNWLKVFQLAESRGALRIILVSLLLTNKVFDLPLPGVVHVEISRDTAVTGLANIFHKKIVSSDAKDSDHHEGLETAMLIANLRTGWRFRIGHYRHLLNLSLSPTDKEIDLIPLSGSLRILYRLLRPIRLFIKYLPYILRIHKPAYLQNTSK